MGDQKQLERTDLPSGFGQWLRLHRKQKNISLRSFAVQVGISATYLSHVEQGLQHPTAERITRMAEILGVDADEMLGIAGRISEDLIQIILNRPADIASLLRTTADLSPAKLKMIIEYAERLRDQERRRNVKPR